MPELETIRTVQSSIIWLDVCFLDFAILNDESIPLAACTTKDGSSAVKIKFECFGELERWIGNKANLILNASNVNMSCPHGRSTV